MKLSDDEYDKKNNKPIAVLLGIATGLISGFLASHDVNATYIFLGILIGTLISLKIDGIHHLLSLIFFIATLIFFGGSDLNLIILAICIITSAIDEIGNDNSYIYKKSKILKTFFDYRFTMKIAIFILSVLGLINILNGFSTNLGFLAPETIIYFILFEISYEIARIRFRRYL
ncbi:MAG: hypothetical protein LBV42_00760 [Methanobrevibacter sp.]|nr:hypothetical protein [Methanobrevibacter sp.]